MKIRIFLFLMILPIGAWAEFESRAILALWDSQVDSVVEDCLIHKTLEMPLNHLGMDLIYHDVKDKLPTLSKEDGIRGILISFSREIGVDDPEQLIRWLVSAVALGKKVVLMGNIGFLSNRKGQYTSTTQLNRIFERMGFNYSEEWVDKTEGYEALKVNASLIPFEKPLPKLLPPFYRTKAFVGTEVILSIGIPNMSESNCDSIMISPQGGYCATGYANYYDSLDFNANPRLLGWYINPFLFFEKAFGLAQLPIPDVTTLTGLRIFINTCHGDSFNASTNIEDYAGQDIYNSEVILEKIIKPNPDLPIAVGFIAADFDPEWARQPKSVEIARRYFVLPQVEIASHSYSHPFWWEFFRDHPEEKEENYLAYYPYGSWENSFLSWFRAKADQLGNVSRFKNRLKWGYFLPRAYANQKFDVKKEIVGSTEFLNKLIDREKLIKLFIWPGDSRPWDVPVRLSYDIGLNNFGGGYVRFDSDHPSLLFVYPLGRKPGGYIQVYSPANGDNDYTNGWKDTFYGFQFLPETLKNTEHPRRLKPMTLYFHSYSGEFGSSVNAILKNIEYIRSQIPISIEVGRYCEIGKGFFTTQIEKLDDRSWKIHQRQGLHTIRFDKPEYKSVDTLNSKGVIGFKSYQDSLYVFLDPEEKEPIISLGNMTQSHRSYLLDSNWELWGLKNSEKNLRFYCKGWGELNMRWKMASPGHYKVTINGSGDEIIETDPSGVLTLHKSLPYNALYEVVIEGP